MRQGIDRFFRGRKEYGPFFVRLITGFHLIYGVQDNILSWERMTEFETFLDANNFPVPIVSAVVSVYAQFACGILYIIGAYVRLAAILMIFNFLAALTVHTSDPYPVYFPALVMLCSSLFLLFHGPGKLAIDRE